MKWITTGDILVEEVVKAEFQRKENVKNTI